MQSQVEVASRAGRHGSHRPPAAGHQRRHARHVLGTLADLCHQAIQQPREPRDGQRVLGQPLEQALAQRPHREQLAGESRDVPLGDDVADAALIVRPVAVHPLRDLTHELGDGAVDLYCRRVLARDRADLVAADHLAQGQLAGISQDPIDLLVDELGEALVGDLRLEELDLGVEEPLRLLPLLLGHRLHQTTRRRSAARTGAGTRGRPPGAAAVSRRPGETPRNR